MWCPLLRPFIFPLVIKLARKVQRNPSVTVHVRNDNHLSPSLDENAKESFDLAFHSILLYPAGPLHILTRYTKRILQTSIYFTISILWLVEDSFVFLSRRFQSRKITKPLKKEAKPTFLAVLFSRGIRVLRFITVSNGGQEQKSNKMRAQTMNCRTANKQKNEGASNLRSRLALPVITVEIFQGWYHIKYFGSVSFYRRYLAV